jgi:hypothetical protein
MLHLLKRIPVLIFLALSSSIMVSCGGGRSDGAAIIAPSSLNYSLSAPTYLVGIAIVANTPVNGGGTIDSYSVTPALPAGLSLNSQSGAITGTPSAVTGVSSYSITGANRAGSATAILNLGVRAAVTDVYIAGTVGGYATIWKNGVATTLSHGERSTVASGLTLSGNDIYVSGNEFNDYVPGTGYTGTESIPRVWKNGVTTALTDGARYAFASAVAVSGSDVYVAGYAVNGAGRRVATLWKNGIATALADGAIDTEAKKVLVSDNDVYVAVQQRTNTTTNIMVWKNGVATLIGEAGADNFVSSLAVAGGNVYVGGDILRPSQFGVRAMYWKNGTPIELDNTPGSLLTSLLVANGTVYASGRIGSSAASWSNGLSSTLNRIQSRADGIALAGNDVYVVGVQSPSEFDMDAMVWKNGEEAFLTDRAVASQAVAVVTSIH